MFPLVHSSKRERGTEEEKSGGVEDELDDDEEQNDDAEEGQIDAEGEREVESAVVDESEEKETLCLCRK